MDRTEKTKKKAMLSRLKKFTLMDDDFMTRFFEDDRERTQFVLQTILGNKIKVVEEVSQKVVKSLSSRSVRLDVFARDRQGRPYDIEIQRADKGAGEVFACLQRHLPSLLPANVSFSRQPRAHDSH